MALTGEEHKFNRRCRLAWPVHQHAHGVKFSRLGVSVQQQHRFSLQALGTVDCEQAHGILHRRRRGLHATGFESAHQGIRRGVTATAELQRHTQQRTQIGQHRLALRAWCRHCKAGQHVAITIDGLQRIVRRKLVNPAFPAGKNGC